MDVQFSVLHRSVVFEVVKVGEDLMLLGGKVYVLYSRGGKLELGVGN